MFLNGGGNSSVIFTCVPAGTRSKEFFLFLLKSQCFYKMLFSEIILFCEKQNMDNFQLPINNIGSILHYLSNIGNRLRKISTFWKDNGETIQRI